MKVFKRIAWIGLSVLVWTIFVGLGFINGFLLRGITSSDTSEAFIEVSTEEIENEVEGSLAMVLIEDGEVSQDFFYSIDQPVNGNTVFPVASVSKWVTSFGIMKLVEQGKVDLDKPIDDYLTRWHLPESDFDNRKVTVRRLLSHSAGLVDDLGYEGFARGEKVQTIEESLTKASDSPYAEGVARVGVEPDTEYLYSGAGYTILQLLIEEISGQSFQDYMTEAVFEPLRMNNSTFVLADKPNLQLAQLYKEDGTLTEPRTFTALAAASLFTSTADLSKFLIANLTDNPVLRRETILQMSKPETFINKIGVYGLGPHLYSQNDAQSNIIGHDGSGGTIVINTAARVNIKSNNGIIALTMGNPSVASEIADEWLFWEAGIADFVVMQRNIPFLIKLLVVGYLVILAVSISIIRKVKSES
ncbi:CubicO group peptidase, beta-lactamase class C family [Algoriphagus locisalis]|uniref:CubicO group peptidase, beta-lactamase class C family n=1 Tax=Algoriphagus locisalis TaxID=305507 RepID=A0A1I6XI54_9BACT|nr:serine hydrolase domain-containing protein [Algoriphagus locisalis]SFT37999.1 CubicO group peptidase, beta-lactamase class C family [Algoriphagus locisalis]